MQTVGLLISYCFYTFNKWVGFADEIQTGCEHFQERVEGYQKMFASLHKDQFNILLQSKEIISMIMHFTALMRRFIVQLTLVICGLFICDSP